MVSMQETQDVCVCVFKTITQIQEVMEGWKKRKDGVNPPVVFPVRSMMEDQLRAGPSRSIGVQIRSSGSDPELMTSHVTRSVT